MPSPSGRARGNGGESEFHPPPCNSERSKNRLLLNCPSEMRPCFSPAHAPRQTNAVAQRDDLKRVPLKIEPLLHRQARARPAHQSSCERGWIAGSSPAMTTDSTCPGAAIVIREA